jgi:photosystem II stability/assembly factor-like uncharacterized protein
MNCKNKKLVIVLCTLVLFLFLNIISYAQPGWFPLQSASNSNLYSIYFINVNTGYITGDLGNILRTTDGGASWNIQTITPNVPLNSVFFADANTGYICGVNGLMVKTINGGLNWVNQQSNTQRWLNSVYFTDANTGYSAGSEGIIIKTTNGGSAWFLLNPGSQTALNSIFFPGPNIGYAVGGLIDLQGVIIKTMDAGAHWIEVLNTGKVLRSVYFVNDYTGYAAGGDFEPGNIILKTTNGGKNWVEQFSSLYSGTLNGLSFVDALTGYCSSTLGIIKTTNGGSNWFTQYLCSYPFLNSMFMVNTAFGFAAGGNGLIMKTTNCGNDHFDSTTAKYYPLEVGNCWAYTNWYSQYGEYYNSGMTRCRIISDTTLQNGHKYFKFDYSPSVCGGINQLERLDSISMNVYRFNPVNYKDELYDSLFSKLNGTFLGKRNCGDGPPVVCIDTSSSLLFGSQMKSKRFSADGLIYSEYTITKNIGFTSYFCSEGSMWGRGLVGCVINGILYGDTIMYYLISGLVTYQGDNQPVPTGYVKALKYDRIKNKIITLDSTKINDGLYILHHVPQDSCDIMAYADDEELDFVPTYHDSTIFWQDASGLYPTSNLTNINIKVSRINNPGFLNHISGSIYSTTNSPSNELEDAIVYAKLGNEYKNYSISGSNGSYRIDSLPQGCYNVIVDRMGYYSETKFVIVNRNFTIVDFYLKKFSGVDVQSVSIPHAIKLEQNYPNPFNPVTSIKFDIPRSTHVTITIYDILGRVVVNLIDSQMKPGFYKADWNANDFSSGVYFYRLITDDFTETKKMLLVK